MVRGKAGEDGQNSGDGAAALTLDMTVGSQVWRHSQGLRQCEGSARSEVGTRKTSLQGRHRLGHQEVKVETAQCTMRPT